MQLSRSGDHVLITPAWGVDLRGRMFRRGYRAHCGDCGYLSKVTTYKNAHELTQRHRRECAA